MLSMKYTPLQEELENFLNQTSDNNSTFGWNKKVWVWNKCPQ